MPAEAIADGCMTFRHDLSVPDGSIDTGSASTDGFLGVGVE